MNIELIWAQDEEGGIGKNGKLPWQISEDLKNFKKITSGFPVIMGRKTWESIPEKHRALPERICYVVSRNKSEEFKEKVESYNDTFLVNDLDSIVGYVTNVPYTNVWLIGGSELYKRMIDSFSLSNIYLFLEV